MRKILRKVTPLIFLIYIVFLTGCGDNKNSIVGTWTSENGEEVIMFNKDGSCSVPFTYDSAWLESLDRYSIDDEGTLILSSSLGNISAKRYKKVEDEDEATGKSYYISKNKIIISGRIYNSK